MFTHERPPITKNGCGWEMLPEGMERAWKTCLRRLTLTSSLIEFLGEICSTCALRMLWEYRTIKYRYFPFPSYVVFLVCVIVVEVIVSTDE